MIRVYVIHADEDYLNFDKLAAQAKSARLNVEFEHMPTKQPWVPHWKSGCHNKIYRCDGAIAFLSKHTAQGGVAWELECAESCAHPMLGLYIEGAKPAKIPDELDGSPVIAWNWPEIEKYLRSLDKGSSAKA